MEDHPLEREETGERSIVREPVCQILVNALHCINSPNSNLAIDCASVLFTIGQTDPFTLNHFKLIFFSLPLAGRLSPLLGYSL